eukprot:TRINITY_DN1271_c0_g2_i1.p1 TRINITY_DN1271_c0_g2~~TRINITY_DN1271_c0_g2_i1.p1  ORF type:complete len:323 (+),score=42.14 TRINITY_DN1271_c0_g2_i1:26-994(+)
MKAFSSLFVIVFLAAAVVATKTDYQETFAQYMREYKKVYSQNELLNRFSIWKKNFDFILQHNAQNHSYRLKMNAFGDLTDEEFTMTKLGPKLNHPAQNHSAVFLHPNYHRVFNGPDAVDWRQQGAVSAVRDEAFCTSDYAITAAGALEGLNKIKTGNMVVLSPQELIDCSENLGCAGGLVITSFGYAQDKKGMNSEDDYPYISKSQKCQAKPTRYGGIQGTKTIPSLNEAALLSAVAVGPVAVTVEADQPVFKFYDGGVLDNPRCGFLPTHHVLIVGYGSDRGKDYWIAKNSWGISFGEHGFIRILSGKNICGISTAMFQPY